MSLKISKLLTSTIGVSGSPIDLNLIDGDTLRDMDSIKLQQDTFKASEIPTAVSLFTFTPTISEEGRRHLETCTESHMKVFYSEYEVSQCLRAQIIASDLSSSGDYISPMIKINLRECHYYGEDAGSDDALDNKGFSLEFEGCAINPDTTLCTVFDSDGTSSSEYGV